MSVFSETPVTVENTDENSMRNEALINAIENGDEISSDLFDGDTSEQEETDDDTEFEEEDNPDDDTDTDDDTNETSDDEDEADDEEVGEVVDEIKEQAYACAELLNKSGIDYDALCDEYKENGTLSKASIKQLEKAGYSQALIQGYISGQQAKFEVYSNHVKAMAGGDEAYEALTEWAGENLSDKEINRFNKAVESYDVDEARFAVEALMAKYEKANPRKPEYVHGRTDVQRKGVRGYNSLQELARAQRDPRYETDAKYTREVEARILASNF